MAQDISQHTWRNTQLTTDLQVLRMPLHSMSFRDGANLRNDILRGHCIKRELCCKCYRHSRKKKKPKRSMLGVSGGFGSRNIKAGHLWKTEEMVRKTSVCSLVISYTNRQTHSNNRLACLTAAMPHAPLPPCRGQELVGSVGHQGELVQRVTLCFKQPRFYTGLQFTITQVFIESVKTFLYAFYARSLCKVCFTQIPLY